MLNNWLIIIQNNENRSFGVERPLGIDPKLKNIKDVAFVALEKKLIVVVIIQRFYDSGTRLGWSVVRIPVETFFIFNIDIYIFLQ